MTTTTPTVAVVGPGAIGTTIAAMLHEVGRTPVLCGRTARATVQLEDEHGRVTVPGPVQTAPSTIAATVDVVFLAVKTTQLDAAAPWLAALCASDTVVCVLQNGVEHEAVVRPHLTDGAILPAVVWFPAETQPTGVIRLHPPARLTVPDVPAAAPVLAALAGTRCAVEQTTDFASIAWRKLLQNAAAGLMVLTGRRSGMFRRADIEELSLAYLQECLQVARADGALLGDEVPQQILAVFQGFPADLGTSILADREADRPMEWDARNAVVQRRGRALGVATPISDIVVPLLAAASDGPG